MPTHAKWAAGLLALSGVVLMTAALLAISLNDAPASTRLAGFAGAALISGALVAVAWQLHRRQQWAHRTAVALAGAQTVTGIVLLFVGDRGGGPWSGLLLLWLLLHPKTRRWFTGEPGPHPDRALDEPSPEEINRRFADRRD